MIDNVQDIPLSLYFLVATVVIAIGTAIYVGLADADRRATLERVSDLEPERLAERLLISDQPSRSARFAEWMSEFLPAGMQSGSDRKSKLVYAGYDGVAAPILFTTFRLASALFFPVVGYVLAPRNDPMWMMVFIGAGLLIGIAGPQGILDRLVASRQAQVRRAVPDALDLLVVCMEAGVSLDAAIMRVSRDMAQLHPALSLEMAQVVRRTSAGIPRDKALQGLWTRTGVEELRALVASMIQCERLGTSIARVLRINAETLRTRRRQHAEKRAAEAALKMIFPLALFLLPALLIVIVGPALIEILRQFGNLSQ